jgi:hypothetical protein
MGACAGGERPPGGKGGIPNRISCVSTSASEYNLKERNVRTIRRPTVALFVDRSSRRWIVRDPEGNYWFLPLVDDPWDHREPYQPTDEAELEPIPGHYKDLLGLPF